ncbi:hypothetical protein QTI66_34180 [Variovorax sp. J22R133]|uniref:hypothetical protein n=1 Tax=Variovorax brevis TaxID=3053503 RepID=UPI0025785E54|nr:hypothetical protein [Variovorax sp. J22R133]MDM0117175.1 hypothetical protein [Variovorax sp. J22R133]
MLDRVADARGGEVDEIRRHLRHQVLKSGELLGRVCTAFGRAGLAMMAEERMG